MSGHSHWATIKHKKGAADKKRGQLFSKISQIVSIAAKKGGDPNMNSELRMAIEQAKKANMPQINIEKAIKRGTGEIEGESLEEFCFEAYGPSKSALIIIGITNNRNRSLNEIKQILNQNNAKFAESGSVRWQFENMGVIIINPDGEEKEKIEMIAIESGIEDIKWKRQFLEIYTKPERLEQVKKEIGSKNLKIESATMGWVARKEIILEKKEEVVMEKLFFDLDNNDDVHEIYSNVNL